MNYTKYIKDHVLRCEYTRRGGGIEISLRDFFNSSKDFKMTAYQNYLGGGMLGRVCHSYNFNEKGLDQAKQKKLEAITEALKEYFFNMTNEEATDYDEWSNQSYIKNQNMPVSAY